MTGASKTKSRKPPLLTVYGVLRQHFGPQAWWPARTRFEMMVGAILTQNTAWTNVEKALRGLRRAGWLTPAALAGAPEKEIAARIRSAGYFNQKTKRLKIFSAWLMKVCGGRLDRLFRQDTARLRHQLLGVHGIGKETADSILLYAAHKPVFVVDAYTRRFMMRHGWLPEAASYDEVAAIFEHELATVPEKQRVALYNEYHALIVALAKRYCRTKPDCHSCPLQRWLP